MRFFQRGLDGFLLAHSGFSLVLACRGLAEHNILNVYDFDGFFLE